MPNKKKTTEGKAAGGKSGKKHKKDSQLIIRISGEERDRFIALCDALDTSAAREVRGFIRGFLKKHEHSDDA